MQILHETMEGNLSCKIQLWRLNAYTASPLVSIPARVAVPGQSIGTVKIIAITQVQSTHSTMTYVYATGDNFRTQVRAANGAWWRVNKVSILPENIILASWRNSTLFF